MGRSHHDGAMSRTASKRDPHKASASHDAGRGTYADAPGSRNSSILFLRMIGSMFMRVNSRRAHQVRPPLGRIQKERGRWHGEGELLYELLQGNTRMRCELVDHGQSRIEARIHYNEEHRRSHTFAPWHCIPFATPRRGGDPLGRG